jgi:hypothetical protein
MTRLPSASCDRGNPGDRCESVGGLRRIAFALAPPFDRCATVHRAVTDGYPQKARLRCIEPQDQVKG